MAIHEHPPLESYLGLAPKAELHVHLEGAIQPATVLALAHRNHIPLPVQTIEGMQQLFVFRDFPHFIEVYVMITRCLKSAADYEQVAYEFGTTMADQRVRYAEVTFSPCTHNYLMGVPFETYFTGLTRGRERAKRDFGVEINWIFDIVRDVASGAGISERADYTTAVAIEGKNDGVIALGLGGTEVDHPPEWFARWFDKARAAGLHSVPHAGETVGPASIWGAIQALGAERIGHGVRAIEDPRLVAYLAEKQIPLEVSPTSNLRLGIYPDIASHPLPLLHAAGVPLTVNSDDPSLFNTTLTHELELLVKDFHFDLNTLNELLLNGVRHSFLPADRKNALEAAFQDEINELEKNTYQK
jgi:aminodeoxyfutalosine deaminase